MPCTRPLPAYRDTKGTVTVTSRRGGGGFSLEVPCGQCIDCRIAKARDWALRMMFEARDHQAASFVTLTYDQEHVPRDYGLSVRTWQLFAKRLRKACGPFRFYMCGEYGQQPLDYYDHPRPHYHVALFGLDFAADREPISRSSDFTLYTSPLLGKLWPNGFNSIGELNFDTAMYVAKYVTKKRTGKQAARHYERVDKRTGEVWNVIPEFSTQSRRPGIGKGFFEKYAKEIYDNDSVVAKGREYRPPRYFDRLLEQAHQETHDHVQHRRKQRHRDREDRERRRLGFTPRQHSEARRSRYRDREMVLLAKESTKSRTI